LVDVYFGPVDVCGDVWTITRLGRLNKL